jgi:nucleotide-binding universal stress UspA family protein
LETIARSLLENCSIKLLEARLRVKSHLASGIPHRETLQKAKEEKADLIVMGTHGRTGVEHLLLGSVAEKVVRLSPYPVLTVRLPPARQIKAEGLLRR